MDTINNATAFQINTFGIEGDRYGVDPAPISLGQGPWIGGTWPIAVADMNDMTLDPKFDALVHAHTVPAISIDAPFPFDNGAMFDVSPTSFTETPFHGSLPDLQRDGSWDNFSQHSDSYNSILPSLPNDNNWEALSQPSDGDHGMLRSLSFGGSSDTQFMDGLHDPMTTSTMALQAQSLPSRFEDGLYDPSHKSESVSSLESSSEIQTEAGAGPSSSCQLTFYKMTRHENTGAMVATATGEGKKPRGRHGPLDPKQRAQAARMRKTGSCAMCRHRKSKCDGGIYCSACVKYFKGKRPPQPCRAQAFDSLSEILLSGHVFPKNRPLVRYLGDKFSVENDKYRIKLNFGFGIPFQAEIKLVRPSDKAQLIHRHVEYPWKVASKTTIARKKTSLTFVFPAILANLESLPAQIEAHISLLLNESSSFGHFPLYRSEFEVLPQIYFYYRELPENIAKPLHHALILLILVHIGGDTKLDEECQSFSLNIVAQYFPEMQDSSPFVSTPCFIRGQLGPIFAKLATHHMKEVLGHLEKMSFSLDYKLFPVVLSTFAVLFMAIESIQYHAAKESYHASYDSESARESEKIILDENDREGVENLLNFYKACFGECHTKLHDGVVSYQHFASTTLSNALDPKNTAAYLKILKGAIDKAKPYLVLKKNSTHESKDDMSFFFDRLLAKLFLITSKS